MGKIVYGKLLAMMDSKGLSTYKIRKNKIISESTLQKIRENRAITTDSIASLCEALDCQPGDLLEYVPDKNTNYTKSPTLRELSQATQPKKNLCEQSLSAPTLKELSKQTSKVQPLLKSTSLPEYLTTDILEHIDAKRYLTGDTAYQIEIGKVIGMEHLSNLAEFLQTLNTK